MDGSQGLSSSAVFTFRGTSDDCQLMEQTVEIVSRRSAAPGRRLCLWRLTAGQNAGDRQHCSEPWEDDLHNVFRMVSEYSLLPLMLILVIFPKNSQDEPGASANRNQKTNHGDAGVTKNPEGGFNTHHQRRPDNQRGEQNTGGDPIGDFFEAVEQMTRVGGFDVYFQFRIADGIQNLVHAPRQAAHKILHLEKRSQ